MMMTMMMMMMMMMMMEQRYSSPVNGPYFFSIFNVTKAEEPGTVPCDWTNKQLGVPRAQLT